MNASIIITVKHGDRCKLISVDTISSFFDFKNQVCVCWPDLSLSELSFSATVGDFRNVDLGNDDDLKNLVSICRMVSIWIIVVQLYSNDLPTIVQAVNNGGGQESNDISMCTSVVVDSDLEENDGLAGGCLGSESLLGVRPSFDVCPSVPKKPKLSDEWASLMDGGVGQIFRGGVVEFRKSIIKYSTKMGFDFKYKRNDARYVTVTCGEDSSDGTKCNWLIKAKIQPVTNYFVISEANMTHKCVGQLVNKKSNRRFGPKIMCDLVAQNVKNNPNFSGVDVMNLLKDGYGFDVPYHKGYRSAEAARSDVFGKFDESYDDLRWYCEAILIKNPGSVVSLEVNDVTNRFERVFVAYKACIDGFVSCRPMLFVDGTFMKGRAKGTILVATAKDGNNGLFPVAFAVVSAENITNWEWFLKKIRDHVKHDRQIFYVSDRNCGLMTAFNNVFEKPVHFFCLYHLVTNLKGRFKSGWSKDMKEKMIEHFKQCAYAPNERIFHEKMATFKEVGGRVAEDWLVDLPVEKWAIAFTIDVLRYGEMTSNAAESFNKWILEARSMPITLMMDVFRKKLGKWFVDRRKKSERWCGALVPRKEKRWNILSDFGSRWNVAECSGGLYEVSSNRHTVVDLSKKECTCYQWQVTGFPCAHAVAVIRKTSNSCFNYVDKCFLSKEYSKCYVGEIYPIPESMRYDISPVRKHKILPPKLNRKPGRPKKKRKLSFGEGKKLAKKKILCRKCFTWGNHDESTCSVAFEEESHMDPPLANDA